MLKHEITRVGSVAWEGAFVQLAEVLGMHEQLADTKLRSYLKYTSEETRT